jgi:choline dehydrogenase-like flavoprotein
LTPPDADIEAMYNYSYNVSAHGNSQSPAKIGFPEFQYPDMCKRSHRYVRLRSTVPHATGADRLLVPFKNAFTELELPFVEEPAAGNAVGHFWSPSSINAKTATRTSSLYAYYDSVSKRTNLKFLARHQVTEVLFDTKLKATGVRALNRDEEQYVTFDAKKEVILAAGAIFTPQILQLSGIGPKSVLEAAGVTTKLDFPAVGSNFQDHPAVYLSFNITSQFPNPSSLLNNATFFEEARKLYVDELTGPLTKAQSSYVGFLSLSSITKNAEALLTDAEASSTSDFLPEIYSTDKRLVAGFEAQRKVLIKSIRSGDVAVLEVPISGGGLIPNAMQKPFSRGTVHLNATDPTGIPVVLHNSLAHPFDRATIFEALKFTRRLVNSASVASLHPVEVTPGAQYIEQDATIERLIASGALSPTFSHASCSCPMMPQELGGVVDSKLRVYGTKKLSIIDASILPVIPAAHLQATMYSVAEKAADIIKARG